MIPLKVFLVAAPLLMPIADGKKGCHAYKPFNTEIKVNVHVLDSLYEYNVPRELLTQSRKKAIETWQAKQSSQSWATGDLSVAGLAGGATWTATHASIIGKPYDWYGQYYCPYIQSLDISLYYNTMIFVAKEKKQGSCEFKATLEHEEKHHQANVAALEEAVAKLRADLPEIIAYVEERPVPGAEMQENFNILDRGISDAVRVYGKYASDLMKERNQKIDVVEEYERVDNQCPR